MAVRIYGWTPIEQRAKKKDQLAKLLSVDTRTVYNWLHDLDEAQTQERNAKIMEMYLACDTQEEIAEAVGINQANISRLLCEIENLQICIKPDLFDGIDPAQRQQAIEDYNRKMAQFADDEFEVPIYNIWSFASLTNKVSHFGNSEQRILERLLYAYTDPFHVVLDPFAGGGSSGDVCQRRLRRCWMSDRKPVTGQEMRIRQLDINHQLPNNLPWADLRLTYLDPPYWRQAENQYSQDKEDLANMPLAQFTDAIVGVIRRIAEKQKAGVIAMLMSPTQWRSEVKGAFTDHIFDVIQGVSRTKKLTVENRISCPYSTEQYNGTMVEIAKSKKIFLVLTRELVVWRIL